MNKDLEGAKAVISDLVQEKELTFIVDVLKTTKRCVGPLADLLRMVDGYAASLEHDGEMYRRVQELAQLLNDPRIKALIGDVTGYER